MQTRYGTTTKGITRRKLSFLARRRFFERAKNALVLSYSKIGSISFPGIWRGLYGSVRSAISRAWQKLRGTIVLIFKEDASFRAWPGLLGICIGLCLCFGYASYSMQKNASILSGSKYVSLSVDGMKAGVITRAENVQGLLASLGVAVHEGDSLNISLSSALEDGDLIFIRRAITVFIKDNSGDGSLISLRVSGGTVGDALSKSAKSSENAIMSGAVNPAPSTPVKNGMIIEVDSVSKEVVTTTQEVPYSVIRNDDPSLLRGNEKVVSEGAAGEREVTMQIVYVNGQEISRAVISNIITKEATDKVINVGSKAPATPKPSSAPTKKPSATTARASSTPKPTASPGKTNALGSVDSAANTVTIDGKTYTIAETRSMEITAYTHTGNKTATGKWPQVGMAAINRSEFSYGTKFYIPGYGLAIAEDTGVRGSDRIDIFMNTYDECIQWGRKRNYTVYILE